MATSLNFLDLFAGAGGLTEGFIKVGFGPIAHVEMDKTACFTLKTRTAYHHLKEGDQLERYVAYMKADIDRKQLYGFVPQSKLDGIVNLAIGKANNDKLFRLIDGRLAKGKVDVIIGGPPCQAYSIAGRARDGNGMKNDPRNFLFIEYARFVQRYKPKMFVFENVTGLRSANNGGYLRRMLLTFRNIAGYDVKEYIVTARDFDVLQNRKRIILIGCRKDLKIKLPDLKTCSSDFVVSDALNDLPSLQAGEGLDRFMNYESAPTDYLKQTGIRTTWDTLTQNQCRQHSEQDKEIYRIAVEQWNEHNERLDYNDLPEHLKTHTNRSSFCDRFKVVATELKASQTIVAHIAKDGNYFIHPDIKQNRSLSVREAARLQSFPDDYYFEGEREGKNRTAAFKQIGNAVPPLLAWRIAELIKTCL